MNVDGVGADRDDRERSMVGRKAQPMNEELATIQRTQGGRNGIAKADDAEQPIIGGVDDGNRVRELFCSVYTVAIAYRYVGGAGATALARRVRTATT